MNTVQQERSVTRNRLRKVRAVELRFFEDDATGEWGLAPKEVLEHTNNYGETFNAFWDGRGIAHDILEHSHEFTHKYFRGDAAMNVGGEIAAMGAMWYYYTHGMGQRLDNSFFGYQTRGEHDITISSTCDMQQEAITDARMEYGNTLVCHVPDQKPVGGRLEEIIREHFERIRDTEAGERLGDSEESYALACAEYKASVTFHKLANLYRYGYRMGQKLFGDDRSNGDVAQDFVDYWNKFCKVNNAAEIANSYRGITFTLYKDREDMIHWKARFNPDFGSGVKPVVLRGGPDGVPQSVNVFSYSE